MTLKKFFLLCSVAYMLVISNPTFSQENPSEAFKCALEKLFSPKKIEFCAENCSQNFFKKIYIKAEEAITSELPLEMVEIEAEDVEFNSPEEWKEGNIKILSVKNIKLIMLVTEENLNKFLSEKIRKNNIDGLRKANVKIKRDFLYLAASYQIDGLPLRILVELKSKLGIEESKIVLKDYKLYLSGLAAGDDFTYHLLSKINPVFDLKKLPFPVEHAQIEQSDGKIIIRTTELPHKPTSLSFTWRDNSNPTHIRN
ncbi:MAG: DUF2993 domain-containing protein [Synergistetes bacterium]|nr:DUF2993 domain-containing protein [Synergistota bacterium]MCX8127647.1 DUF2993 domain-containing protein [Synergistota bacterium]MDW8191437.1 DUF2993 domain-containing protein [Synergistota bacterium]